MGIVRDIIGWLSLSVGTLAVLVSIPLFGVVRLFWGNQVYDVTDIARWASAMLATGIALFLVGTFLALRD